jgi:hypothetical protein
LLLQRLRDPSGPALRHLATPRLIVRQSSGIDGVPLSQPN